MNDEDLTKYRDMEWVPAYALKDPVVSKGVIENIMSSFEKVELNRKIIKLMKDAIIKSEEKNQ